jgi:hypothetical protein
MRGFPVLLLTHVPRRPGLAVVLRVAMTMLVLLAVLIGAFACGVVDMNRPGPPPPCPTNEPDVKPPASPAPSTAPSLSSTPGPLGPPAH